MVQALGPDRLHEVLREPVAVRTLRRDRYCTSHRRFQDICPRAALHHSGDEPLSQIGADMLRDVPPRTLARPEEDTRATGSERCGEALFSSFASNEREAAVTWTSTFAQRLFACRGHGPS